MLYEFDKNDAEEQMIDSREFLDDLEKNRIENNDHYLLESHIKLLTDLKSQFPEHGKESEQLISKFNEYLETCEKIDTEGYVIIGESYDVE